MSFNKVKSVPSSATNVVDVLAYTIVPSSSASVSLSSYNDAVLYLEDLRGHLIELELNLDALIQLKNSLQAIVSISQSPIQVRTRNIMLGKNTVTFNKEVSPFIDASKFESDYDAILNNAFDTNIYWDLGNCLVIPNGDFYVILSNNRTGVDRDDIALVYRSTLIASLVTLQSINVFDSIELNVMSFRLDTTTLVQDPTVVHFRESVLLNHEGLMYVARKEVVEIALKAIESGDLKVDVNNAFSEIGISPANNSSYRLAKVYTQGSEATEDLNTYIEFTSLLGSGKDDLRMYLDGSIYLGSVYGTIVKSNSSYLNRPHCMTRSGVGTPPSLLKDNYINEVTNFEGNHRPAAVGRQSRLFTSR